MFSHPEPFKFSTKEQPPKPTILKMDGLLESLVVRIIRWKLEMGIKQPYPKRKRYRIIEIKNEEDK